MRTAVGVGARQRLEHLNACKTPRALPSPRAGKTEPLPSVSHLTALNERHDHDGRTNQNADFQLGSHWAGPAMTISTAACAT